MFKPLSLGMLVLGLNVLGAVLAILLGHVPPLVVLPIPVPQEAKSDSRSGELEALGFPRVVARVEGIARGQGNKSCAALDGLLSVAPDGAVLPGSSWDEPVGNLLEEPFRDIWLGPKSRYFKEKHFAPEVCKTCSSFVAALGILIQAFHEPYRVSSVWMS